VPSPSSWIAALAIAAGCAIPGTQGELGPAEPCDGKCDGASSNPTREDLLANLHAQMDASSVLFGQERFNLTGVNADGTQWLAGDGALDRSDAASVGGDHPVVMGFDAWDLAIKPATWKPTGKDHAAAAKRVHALGGIVELAFHMRGCAADSFYAAGNEACLCRIANDDAFARSWFLGQYAKVADALVEHGLDDIPIIFRPLHEHTGGWFWWGEPYWSCGEHARYTGEAAFQRVYRTVVSYLRDVRGLDRLLVAYSPGADTATYLHGYPGDEYVDILGADVYYDSSSSFAEQTARRRPELETVTRVARERGKVAALTEVGDNLLATEPHGRWYTEHLLPLLTSPGIDLAYAMTWENRTGGPQQFWVPYPGHPGADDFRSFVASDATALLTDAPALDAPPASGRRSLGVGARCVVPRRLVVPRSALSPVQALQLRSGRRRLGLGAVEVVSGARELLGITERSPRRAPHPRAGSPRSSRESRYARRHASRGIPRSRLRRHRARRIARAACRLRRQVRPPLVLPGGRHPRLNDRRQRIP
jgi:mannan endo-1,4-beta-mannosidase